MKKKRIVMIVDDSKIIVERLILLLEEIGNVGQVIYAYSYREGIKLLNDQEVNIVLLDIQLPEKSGIDILKLIKKQELPVELIIMMSDDDKHGKNKEISIALGADQFIDKFMDFESIGNLVAGLQPGTEK